MGWGDVENANALEGIDKEKKRERARFYESCIISSGGSFLCV